jgi:hypothetical protein
MFVDADDCVSKKLVNFVNQNSQSKCSGWFIERGYEYKDGSKYILLRSKNFHLKCGTSFIIRYDLVIPNEHTTINDIDNNFLYHQYIVEIMLKKQQPLKSLPFEGAIYITENGTNYTNQKYLHLEALNSNFKKFFFYVRRYAKMMFYKPLNNSIREEFSIYNIG